MTESKSRILILTHCFPINASDIPGNFIYDLCKSLRLLNVEVTVLTQKMEGKVDTEFLAESGAGMTYIDWKGGSERFSDLKFSSLRSLSKIFSLVFNGRKKFRQLLRDREFDLVINCWIVPAGLWSYGLNGNIKNVIWALGSDVSVYGRKFIFREILRKIINRSNLVYTNSVHNKKEMKRIFKIEPEVLFSGRPLPTPVKKYEAGKILKLIFIGRLEKIKGPDILISALIESGIKDITLKIIGDGTMRSDLQDKVKYNDLEDRVVFLGLKNAAEIADHLAESDYLVISSRSESMPVVFWEAMQLSIPVISTDVGDIRYYCEEFNVGRVCMANEKSLSELLDFVNNFRPLRESLSQNTKKIAELTDIKNTAKKLIDIIHTEH